MIDFEQTYLHRRTVYRAIQQSQKSESQVAERIGQIAVNGKRELLLLLSAWLLEINSISALSDAERTEIQILTQMSLEEWIKLQAVAVQIERDIAEAESKERDAVAAFQKKAPYGAATRLFADAESKMLIKALQDRVTVTQRHRESLSAALKQNLAKKQVLGETLFRDCLTQLDKLTTTKALGKEATEIMTRMANEINKTWLGHQKQQTEEFVQMAELVETLRVSYKDMPTAVLQQQKVTLE